MVNEDKSRIEKLKQKLYSPNSDIRPPERKILRQIENDLPKEFDIPKDKTDSWVLPKKKMSLFAKIFIVSFLFFVAAVSFGIFTFLNNTTKAIGSVDLKVVGPVQIGASEPLSFDILIENKSQSTLEAVDLVITYPDGTKKVDNLNQDLKEERIYLGDVESEFSLKKTFSAVLFGDEGSSKEISARLEYHLPGSFTLFQKNKDFEIVLTSAPIAIKVDGLKEISAGQPLDLTISLISNSNSELNDVYLIMEYPFGFTVQNIEQDPFESNNVWKFEKMSPKETKTIKIKGTLEGQNEELRGFKIRAGTRDPDFNQESENDLSVIMSSSLHEVLIKKSFVTLDLSVAGNIGPIVAIKHKYSVDVEIKVTNNTNDPLKNVSIVTSLKGKGFSKFSVRSRNGFYNSSDNLIEWNEKTDENLKSIGPRKSYSASFVFDTDDFTLIENVIKNPQIVLDGKVSGKRITGENLEEKVEIKTIKTLKFISPVLVSAETYYHTGPIQNSGPIPPKVEQETTYSVKMNVVNPINKIKDAKIVARLPAYVTWLDQISGNENVSYNAESRQISWNLGEIKELTGFGEPTRTVWVKLGLFPSANQSGTVPILLENIFFSGKDEFSNQNIEIELKPVNIKLNDENTNSKDNEVVK